MAKETKYAWQSSRGLRPEDGAAGQEALPVKGTGASVWTRSHPYEAYALAPLRVTARRGSAVAIRQRRGANRLTKILRRPAQLSGGRPATIVRLARLAGLSFVGLSTAFTPSAIPSLRPTNRALAGCVLRQTLLLLSRVCSCSTRGCVSRGRRGKARGLDNMADVQLTSFSRARAADFLAGSAADPHRW